MYTEMKAQVRQEAVLNAAWRTIDVPERTDATAMLIFGRECDALTKFASKAFSA